MKLAFSWDDGAPQDEKLFELHTKYEIPGMFFVPTRNREGREVLSPDLMRNSESEYIKFGGHTENHIYLTELNTHDVEMEVIKNKEYLENILGHSVEDFCLPGGKYNREILDVIYRHYKTIRTADTMNFSYCKGPLKPSIHFFPRGKKSLIGNSIRNNSLKELMYIFNHFQDHYFELIREIVKFESRYENGIVMIWGHSWEIDEYGLWDELDDFMKFAQQIGCSSYSDLFS